MNKERIETIFRNAGLKPEERTRVQDYDVFLADGFSLPPHHRIARFGVEPHEFPRGCYVTFWWAGKGEQLHAGRPLMFEALHDNEYDLATKKRARLNAALKDAARDIEAWRKAAMTSQGRVRNG